MGVSRARLVQLSNLMKLNPRIVEYLDRNRENLRVVRYISERKLRSLRLSSAKEQWQEFEKMVELVGLG